MPKYDDGSAVYGVFQKLPDVTNPPDGWSLKKVRMRPTEFVTAFYTKGKSIAAWTLRYTPDKKALVPGMILSANIRE